MKTTLRRSLLLAGPVILIALSPQLEGAPGDVKATTADTSALEREMGYKPETTVEEGLARFAEWYRQYYS